jgi:late competence protein required for DNA uptake (superfamily II DNA/RNA helicase)
MDITQEGFIIDLPVYDYRSKILEAVDNNQVTIITAETGAGKSTQIPQYLADHGYTKVIVTQPRILAARNLTYRVREEWQARTKSADNLIIGYRTAHERDDSPDTRILYCTDGLQLVREVTGAGVGANQILVLDEVHEWNENIEVLIAWAKKRCAEDAHFKVVIMSATIETGSLAEFYGTQAIINIPGRSFEVKKRRGTDIVSEIINQIETTVSNMLVFLPGKAEIEDVAAAIAQKAKAAKIPVMPLHSQLELSTQQKVFENYPSGKVILSTNIAQTSITIDDIDVVIDSGLERRSEVRNGVEGLFIAQISQADCLQRAGRAGRTKAGEYILAPYDTMPCLDFNERPEYPTPEILRKHIDRLTLRLASADIDIEKLDFYHDPSTGAIKRAKQKLITLGALTKTGQVTKIGHQMEQYPVESNFGRMLVEAKSFSPAVQSKLAAIIGIQEVGGIVKGGPRYTGWHKYTKQHQSDPLAQYDVFLALKSVPEEAYEDLGIIGKNVGKAREVMERLSNDLGDIDISERALTPISNDEQSDLLRCIVAGQIDQLWVVDDGGNATHIDTNAVREISSSTVVRNPKLVTGIPFDLQVPVSGGAFQTLHLLQSITVCNPNWLAELDSIRFNIKRGRTIYDPRLGMLINRQQVRYGKKILEGLGSPIAENNKANQRSFQDGYAIWAYEQLERERRTLNKFYVKRIPSVPLAQIKQQVQALTDGVVSIAELDSDTRQALINLSKLHTHLGPSFMAQLGTSYRHDSPGRHHAHRGWLPGHKRKHE